MPTFNVLIATIGRPTLERQLRSLVPQLSPEDVLTVVFDGLPIQTLRVFDEFKCPVILYSESTALGWWGHGVRNKYAPLLQKTDFVMHGDDDDVYAPNALSDCRVMCVSLTTLYVARMRVPSGKLIPTINTINEGNIGTPCGIIPWDSNVKGKWGLRYGGDCDFYESVKKVTRVVVFLASIIYLVRSI